MFFIVAFSNEVLSIRQVLMVTFPGRKFGHSGLGCTAQNEKGF